MCLCRRSRWNKIAQRAREKYMKMKNGKSMWRTSSVDDSLSCVHRNPEKKQRLMRAIIANWMATKWWRCLHLMSGFVNIANGSICIRNAIDKKSSKLIAFRWATKWEKLQKFVVPFSLSTKKINILTKRWKLFNYFSNHKSSLILSGRVKISHHKRPREFTIAKQRQQTSNGKQVTRIITSNMMSVYCVLRIASSSFSEDDDTDKRPQWGRRKSAKRTTTTTVSTKHAQNKSKVSRNWFMERMWGIRFSFTPTHSVRSPCIHYN